MKKRLTAVEVERAKHSGKKSPDKSYDGGGLLLRIMPNGSKQWVWQGMKNGKRIERGLGGYPVVTLREAREKAFELKRMAWSGDLPPKKNLKQRKVPTFAEAAEKAFEIQRSSWSSEAHAARWRASLRDYAIPKIGKVPVDKVSGQDVMNCLASLSEKRDTQGRVRQRISAVMRWAIAQGFRVDNPAGEAVSAVLPKANGGARHFRALPYSEVGAAIETIRNSKAHAGTKLAFEFLVLTATRSGETRGATWSEIDLENKVWVVPGERMKEGKEYRIPLSGRALEILREAGKIPGKDGLVFPSVKGRKLSDATLSKLVRENGIKAVPHGFRSSFRDWCVENGVPREVAEASLAHSVARNKVEAAYLRSDLFEPRREVMETMGGIRVR